MNRVNGADGLIVDDDDNLWIAAYQADEIVVLEGGHFPASLVRVGGWIYVTNLSLDRRAFGLTPPVDAFWTDVKRHTVARLRAKIPPLRGLQG